MWRNLRALEHPGLARLPDSAVRRQDGGYPYLPEDFMTTDSFVAGPASAPAAGVTKRLHRVVLKSDTWSGEDVFFARGLPGMLAAVEIR